MDDWRMLEVLGGLVCIAGAIFNKEFAPIGWIVRLIWGKGVKLPNWLADPFYLVLGTFFIYDALTAR